MSVRSLATTVAFALAATACNRTPPTLAPRPTSDGHFALVLEHSAKGWVAHCEAGCDWVDVSMSCGCDVRLDASGIAPAYVAVSEKPGFAFILSTNGSGWKARAIQGVRWESLSWDCKASVCRGRLDETGVQKV